MSYAENKRKAIGLLKAAVEASILIEPRNYGLTRDELLAVAALVGIKDGLANDAFVEAARDLRPGDHGRLWLDGDECGLPGHINADFNFLLEPEVRSLEAFEFVRTALQAKAEEAGERAAVMMRDELVALGESKGLKRHDVEVAIAATLLSRIFVEDEHGVRHAPNRIGWILPSAQRKQMHNHEIELNRRKDIGIVLPHVRAVIAGSRGADNALQPVHTLEKTVTIRIFISHSSVDAKLAETLIHFIEAGLEVPDGAIRCTSVPGYKLEGGDNAPETLRQNIAQCGAVVAIVTKASMSSSFVLLELGAAWMARKRAIPLVGPKANLRDLPAFFSEIHAIELHNTADMAGLIATLAKTADLKERTNQPRRAAALGELVRLAEESAKEPSLPKAL